MYLASLVRSAVSINYSKLVNGLNLLVPEFVQSAVTKLF